MSDWLFQDLCSMPKQFKKLICLVVCYQQYIKSPQNNGTCVLLANLCQIVSPSPYPRIADRETGMLSTLCGLSFLFFYICMYGSPKPLICQCFENKANDLLYSDPFGYKKISPNTKLPGCLIMWVRRCNKCQGQQRHIFCISSLFFVFSS